MLSELVTSLMSPGGAALGALGSAGIYKAWQIFSTDRRRGRQDDNADQFYKDLQDQHKTERDRADRLAAERNSAIQEKALAEARNLPLQEKVADLQTRRAQDETTIASYRALIESLTTRCSSLEARTEVLTLALTHSGAPIPPPPVSLAGPTSTSPTVVPPVPPLPPPAP